MRTINFSPIAFNEYNEWVRSDKATFEKLVDLIKEITRDPFKGKGKPEPLKGNYKGYWSRRITLEDRLIYEVKDQSIMILRCKGHYK